ncbi:hypothetical protein ACQ4PT_019396 [Festuca glaucescens]
METASKVEVAIKKFRDNQKLTAGGSHEKKETAKIRMVAKETVNITTDEKNDPMAEFDQFFLFKESEKAKEVLNAEIRRNISPIVSDGLDKSNEEGIVNSTDVLLTIEVVDQVNEEAGTSKTNDDSSEEEDLHGTDDNNKRGPEYFFPTPEEISNLQSPEEGTTFPTLDATVRFVNVYAHVKGFAVIKGRNYKQRRITLVCNKNRHTTSRLVGPRQRRRSCIGRTNCQMKVSVKLVDTQWKIDSCELQHNHDMAPSPSLTKFFLSHRNMSSHDKMLSQLLQEIRVKPTKIMQVFRRMAGTSGNVNFGKRKLDNLKQGERKNKKNSDIQYTMKYIERLQLTKPGFCCKMDVDLEGSVRSLFWTDARSRMDYKLYGEIICFDTTYSTNKYNMPFAPIIGINGHGRTIVYGWALLKDQTAETFEWIFESFLEVMEQKKPTLILTDQDQAMRNAILAIFPDAWHRFCLWHILKYLKENCSAYMAEKEGMEDYIISLIMESLTTTEFETGWNEMLVTYSCADHDHLKRMWKDRKMFFHAYFRDIFCPFTRTTGRSESFNSSFKDYILQKDTIENFLKQYELFLENVLEIENDDRFQSTQKEPVLWCRQPIERHAAGVYTRGIYLKFVTELMNSTAFGVTEVVKDQVYELRKLFYYEKAKYRRNLFTVFVDCEEMIVECECRKFQKGGILCCHVLRLFTQWDVVRIPDQYIMPRWTTEFREKELVKHKQECLDKHGSNVTHQLLVYATLMNSMNDVCADISRDVDKSREFIEEVQKLHKRLMSEPNKQSSNSIMLKVPPVIRKSSSKNNKDPASEVGSVPETSTSHAGKNINIWVNADGSTSNPVEAKDRNKKKKQKIDAGSSLKDPPVGTSKSVEKGNRMKPQSEINSQKKKNPKKRNQGV